LNCFAQFRAQQYLLDVQYLKRRGDSFRNDHNPDTCSRNVLRMNARLGCVAAQKMKQIWWQWRMVPPQTRLLCPERKWSRSQAYADIRSIIWVRAECVGSVSQAVISHRFQLSLYSPNFEI
jgi:hypothetical protein